MRCLPFNPPHPLGNARRIIAKAPHCVTKGDLQTAALDNSVLAKLQALKLLLTM